MDYSRGVMCSSIFPKLRKKLGDIDLVLRHRRCGKITMLHTTHCYDACPTSRSIFCTPPDDDPDRHLLFYGLYPFQGRYLLARAHGEVCSYLL